MKPTEVSLENREEVFRNLYPVKKLKEPVYKVGDTVRISIYKKIFDKGYKNNFSDEIFTVSQILRGSPNVYTLKDFNGELIEGIFYEKELTLVILTEDPYFDVEKVIKSKKEGGQTHYYVKWVGLSSDFNSWVTDIKKK